MKVVIANPAERGSGSGRCSSCATLEAKAQFFYARSQACGGRNSSLRTPPEARRALFDYIEGWYNSQRRHSALGYESPLRYERNHAAGAVRTTSLEKSAAALPPGATIGQGGRPHEFQYDVYHRMIRWTDRRGIAWNRAYDFASKIAGDTAPQVRVNGQLVRPVTRYASMEKGMLIDSASGLGTSANPGPDIDTVVIRATTTNPRGYPTTYALDRFGAPTLIQEPLGRTTAYTRDTNSAVVQSTLPSGHVIQYTWTGPDLVRVLDATTGRKDTMTYVSHHLAIHAGDVDSVVNYWTINATRVTLDSTHTGGAGMVRFSYTAGRLCRIVDAAGHASQCYFTSTSGFQNTDSIRYALGVVGYRYDGHGQRVMTINQVHDTVKAVYDSLGRIVRTIGGVHDTTTSVYDDSLHVTQLQDAKGQVYRSWFNAVGWVDSTADAASQKDRFQFDSSGHPVGWTNRNGRVITAVYDSLDQKRSVTADGRTATLFTDPAGHFVMTNNGESIDTVRMDAGDRAAVAVSCRVLVNGNAAKCFRDSAIYEMPDIQTHLALFAPEVWANTDTFKVHDHYDVHRLRDYLTPGYVSGQPAPLSILFTHNSEALDSVTTFGPLNNLTMTHSYPWNHVTDQIQFSDPALDGVLGTAANFDSAGRLRTRYHGSLTDPDTARSFTYDRQGNLMQYNDTLHHYTQHCNYSWQTGGFYCNNTDQPTFLDSTTYAYDSVANRKDPAGLIVLDPGNRLRRWQNFRMDYDLVGNLTAKRTLNPVDSTQLLRTDSLFWSTLGTLDSVRTRDGSGVLIGRVGFGYDGMGRRVRKSGGGGTTRYVWDGESLLAELDTLGQLVAGYTDYGLDEIASVLRRDRVDSTYYYVQDYSRNVVAILARTAGGNVIDNQYRYEPFGTLQGNTSAPIPNSRQFAGREYDAETQLYYDRARYLDPTLGRFVSEDPIGLNGGINLYGFVGNDPINGWDPSGTSCKRWSLRQELFRDKAIHFFIGLGLVERWQDHGILKVFKPLLRDASPWGPVHQAWEIGLLHEGPWGIRTPIPGLVFGDHDLTDARGAPCAGWFDIAWFMLVPMINYVMKEGWPWQPTQDMIDGGSPPWWDPAPRMPRRPTSMPPGMGTPGWPVL